MARELPSATNADWPLFMANDGQATEDEVIALIGSLVRATKARVAIELGTYRGDAAEVIGAAMQANGVGQLFSYERDPDVAAQAADRLVGLPVEVRCRDADGAWEDFPYESVDFVFVDAGESDERDQYALQWLQRMRPEGLLLIHDCFKMEGLFYAVRRLAEGLPVLWIRSARGLAIIQRTAEWGRA